MFGKPSKSVRIGDLEEDVDDLWYEVFCDQNPMNINKRLHRLEEFKGVTIPSIIKDINENVLIVDKNFIDAKEQIQLLRDLYERLGQKVKDNDTGAKETVLALFKYLGLTLNEQGEVIKVKKNSLKTKVSKNAKPLSTPKRTTRKKSK